VELMTDYNDGKWHGWNGGECPVHPESVVRIRVYDPIGSNYDNNISKAKSFCWADDLDDDTIIAFRVVTPYVKQPKPREWWATGRHLHDSLAEAEAFIAKVRAESPHLDFSDHDPLHVREVQE
jgi:hypothetical protein